MVVLPKKFLPASVTQTRSIHLQFMNQSVRFQLCFIAQIGTVCRDNRASLRTFPLVKMTRFGSPPHGFEAAVLLGD